MRVKTEFIIPLKSKCHKLALLKLRKECNLLEMSVG